MNNSKEEILPDDNDNDDDVYIMNDDIIEYLIDVSDTNNRLITFIAIFQFLSLLLNIFIFVKIFS